jgi:sec-independent protein translocase protein TatC
MFELPVFIYFLSKAGLVSVSFLKKYRRHAIVISFALAAVITPPDVISQIMVCLPLILLYEVGIAIAKKVELKRKKQEMA